MRPLECVTGQLGTYQCIFTHTNVFGQIPKRLNTFCTVLDQCHWGFLSSDHSPLGSCLLGPLHLSFWKAQGKHSLTWQVPQDVVPGATLESDTAAGAVDPVVGCHLDLDPLTRQATSGYAMGAGGGGKRRPGVPQTSSASAARRSGRAPPRCSPLIASTWTPPSSSATSSSCPRSVPQVSMSVCRCVT